MLAIVLLVEKDALVSRAVGTRLPLRELLLMTTAAPVHQTRNVLPAEADRVAKAAANVFDEAPDVSEMEAGIQRDDPPVTVRALHAAVTGGLPYIVVAANLVAARTRGACRVFVIETAGRQKQNRRRSRRSHNPTAIHTPRPFCDFATRSEA